MAANKGRTDQGAELARYYDLDLLEEPGDIEMYLALAAASDGPILELACGSGRVCVPLAAAGHDVTGVDRDPHMLRRARRTWASQRRAGGGGSLRLVKGDMTKVYLRDRFGLVILALNSLLLADRTGQVAIVRTVARHLAVGGRAALDVWLPAPDDLVLYDGRLVLDWVRRDPETGEWAAKSSSARYDPATATARVHTFYDAWQEGKPVRRVSRTDEVHFIGHSELISMAEAAGLEAETLAGDYAMAPFAADSERLVMVGRSASG